MSAYQHISFIQSSISPQSGYNANGQLYSPAQLSLPDIRYRHWSIHRSGPLWFGQSNRHLQSAQTKSPENPRFLLQLPSSGDQTGATGIPSLTGVCSSSTADTPEYIPSPSCLSCIFPAYQPHNTSTPSLPHHTTPPHHHPILFLSTWCIYLISKPVYRWKRVKKEC